MNSTQHSAITFRVITKMWEKNHSKRAVEQFKKLAENYANSFFQLKREGCGLVSISPMRDTMKKDTRNPKLFHLEAVCKMPSTKTPYQLSNMGQQLVVTKEI